MKISSQDIGQIIYEEPHIMPEKKLWSTVLQRAVREACSSYDEDIRNKARKWIEPNHASYEIGGICWICGVLDITFLEDIRAFVREPITPDKREVLKKLA